MAAKKRREQESMLMTRAYREKLANKPLASSYTYAVVRVRLPEGLLLQVMPTCIVAYSQGAIDHPLTILIQ